MKRLICLLLFVLLDLSLFSVHVDCQFLPVGVGKDKYINEMTDGLSSGIARKDKSCLINNEAGKIIYSPAPIIIKNFLRDECDRELLHYRVQRNGQKCVVFEKSNLNQWINFDIRTSGLKNSKVITTRGFKCGNYEENVVRLWAKRSACLETKSELERRCDACNLKVVAEPGYRLQYENCMMGILKPTDGPAQVNQAAKRCKCIVSTTLGFPQLLCRKDVNPLSPWTKQRLGQCMSAPFGIGESCLMKNKEGKKSLINGQILRNELLKCEKDTLRYKVDMSDGCVYKLPGSQFVWHAVQSGQIQERVSPEVVVQPGAMVRTPPFLGCDKDKNLNSLNVMKQMCQRMKDLATKPMCDSCQLKVLVDAGSKDRVRNCIVNRKLSNPTSFAGPAVDRCTNLEASKLNSLIC